MTDNTAERTAETPPYATVGGVVQAGPSTWLCLTCDYPLRDLATPRCPECGQPFDPGNPATVNSSGRGFSPTLRWCLRPPIRWINVLAIALAITHLLGHFRPLSLPVGTEAAFTHAWTMLTALWVVAAFGSDALRRIHQAPLYVCQRGRWQWAIAPAVMVAGVVGASLHLPFWAAYRICRPDMDLWADRAFETFADQDRPNPPGGWLRWSTPPIDDTYCTGREAAFLLPGASNGRWMGFVYAPQSRRGLPLSRTVTLGYPIGDDWSIVVLDASRLAQWQSDMAARRAEVIAGLGRGRTRAEVPMPSPMASDVPRPFP